MSVLGKTQGRIVKIYGCYFSNLLLKDWIIIYCSCQYHLSLTKVLVFIACRYEYFWTISSRSKKISIHRINGYICV